MSSPPDTFLCDNEGQEVTVLTANRRWRALVYQPEKTARRAARAAGFGGNIMLSDNQNVRRLNWRWRGKLKPTNVLTFENPYALEKGDIILALETLLNEAAAARKPAHHHLAHLVIHGALHLRGYDHHQAGEAREMEMKEAWLMRRIGLSNPWKPRRKEGDP